MSESKKTWDAAIDARHSAGMTMIDAVSQLVAGARGIERDLYQLAEAFETTGNSTVAERLDHIAERITGLAAMVRDAHSGMLRTDNKAGMAEISGILMAIVEGAGKESAQ